MANKKNGKHRPNDSASVKSSIREQLNRELQERQAEGPAAVQAPSGSSASIWKVSIRGLFGRASKREMITFCEELSLLLECGMPLLKGLQTLSSRWENPTFSRVIAQIIASVESGHSFSDATAEHPQIFPAVITSMIRAGEKSGKLDQMLGRIAEQGERVLAIRHKTISTLIYPVIVLAVAAVVVAVVFGVITEGFAVFKDVTGGELPASMKLLLTVGAFCRNTSVWITAGVVVVGLIVLYLLAMRTFVFRLLRDRFLIRFPVVRHFVKQGQLVYFARIFSTLLHSGVPLPEALDATHDASRNEVLRLTIQRVQEAVARGERITEPLRNGGVFPPLACDLCAIGEETGLLDRVFTRMGDVYEERQQAETEILGKVLGPVIILTLALVVAYIVFAFFSMYVNMFAAISPVG